MNINNYYRLGVDTRATKRVGVLIEQEDFDLPAAFLSPDPLANFFEDNYELDNSSIPSSPTSTAESIKEIL